MKTCCGYSLEVPYLGTLMSSHNICFHGEIRKNVNTLNKTKCILSSVMMLPTNASLFSVNSSIMSVGRVYYIFKGVSYLFLLCCRLLLSLQIVYTDQSFIEIFCNILHCLSTSLFGYINPCHAEPRYILPLQTV